MKIIALVVTYNRIKSLQRCLSSLAQQAGSLLYEIIVVDNNSSDGTSTFLQSLGGSIGSTTLTVITMANNTGGAGGFSVGLQYAAQFFTDADVVWTMDDDAYPTETALEELAKTFQNRINQSQLVVLSSAVYFIDSHNPDTLHHRRLNMFGEKPVSPSEYLSDNPTVVVDTASFVGLFIPVRVIRLIGLPLKQFFLIFDDTEYTLRLRKHRITLYLVPASKIVHGGSREDISRTRNWDIKAVIGARNQTITYRMHLRFPFFLVWYFGRIITGITDHLVAYKSPPSPPYRIFVFIRAMLMGLYMSPEISFVSSPTESSPLPESRGY